ncbi:MAG: Ig-like domain-containing protein, partial [Candidatus Rokuibacteriota bacterium]
MPAATAAKMREFAARGGEMIYTDRSLGELEVAFPGYIPVVQYGPTRVVDATMINVPEFPGQYYGNPTVKLYQLGSGAEMNAPVAPEVRVMAFHSPAGTAPTMSLTAPSGGTLNAGNQVAVTWNAAGGTAPLAVDIEYSVSGASGPWVSIARRIANSGSHQWTVPYVPTTEGFARATVWDINWRSAVATSAAAFSISAPQLKLDVGAYAQDYTIDSGASTAVSARVVDSLGVVENATVSFTSAIGGSFNPASAPTDSSGTARTTFTAPTIGSQLKGQLTAVASHAGHVGGLDSLDISVNPTGAAALDVALILKPPVLHSGDTAYVHVKVTEGGAPSSGASLIATTNAGLLTPTTATTNSTGDAVFAYSLPTAAAPMAVSVKVNATKATFLDGTGEVTGNLLPMLDLRLMTTVQRVSLNASEKSKIFVHVDSNSLDIPGAALVFALTGPGSISATSGTSNATGDFELEYTAPSSIPSKTSASVLVRATKPGYTTSERPVWFTLNAIADSDAPVIVSTFPARNATGVPLNTTIVVQWNESMDPVSAQTAFSMMPVVSCIWSWPSGDRQVCTPAAPLQATTAYDVTVTTSARDLAGNKLKSPHQYTFTTGTSGGGGTAPAVQGTSPTDGSQ